MSSIRPLILTQSVHVSVAHRYWNEEWVSQKNLQIYGADSSSEGLGSNLRLDASLRVKPEVGEEVLAQPLSQLKAMVDHQCFFAPSSPLAAGPSTLENLTKYLAQKLFQQACDGEWHALTVWESERLFCRTRPQVAEIELGIKVHNLTLVLKDLVDSTSGLVVVRSEVLSAAELVLRAAASISLGDQDCWSQQMFSALKNQMPTLQELHIDLGRHEYIRVFS